MTQRQHKETGINNHNDYKDGYYNSNWSNEDIINSGFQGKSKTRMIRGWKKKGNGQESLSGATAVLISGGTEHLYNGHFTGTVRNQDANTTHIIISPDARRYID